MAVKLVRNVVLQGIVESTAGTDPGSGYVAVRADEAAIPDMGVTSTPRTVVQSSMSKLSPSLTQRRWDMSATVELAGGGYSAGIVTAAHDWMFRAAALEQSDCLVLTIDNPVGTFTVGELVEKTVGGDDVGYVAWATSTELGLYDVTTATSIADNDGLTGASSSATADINVTILDGHAYRPRSPRASKDTATYHAYLDGIRHISTYTRSTMTMNLSVGPKPTAVFGLSGIYATPTDTANPSATYQAITAPDFKGVTTVFGSVTLSDIGFTTIGIDSGNSIVPRIDAQQSDAIIGFEHTDRDMTFTWDPEVSAISDYNPYALADAQTESRFHTRWGSTQGNRHAIEFPKSIVSGVTRGERDGIAIYNLTFTPEDSNSVDDTQFFYFIY